MFRLVIGFVGGVYVGTYYNCKPIIERVKDCIKKNIPKTKEKNEQEKEKK